MPQRQVPVYECIALLEMIFSNLISLFQSQIAIEDHMMLVNTAADETFDEMPMDVNDMEVSLESIIHQQKDLHALFFKHRMSIRRPTRLHRVKRDQKQR